MSPYIKVIQPFLMSNIMGFSSLLIVSFHLLNSYPNIIHGIQMSPGIIKAEISAVIMDC